MQVPNPDASALLLEQASALLIWTFERVGLSQLPYVL